MNGVGATSTRGGDDLINVEITLARSVRREPNRLVRVADVRGQAVSGRIDSHRRQLQLTTGAHDPNGDLASVGDKDFHESVTAGVSIPQV